MSQNSPKSHDLNLRRKGSGWEARATASGKAFSAYASTKAEAVERLAEKLSAASSPPQDGATLRSWMETAYLPSIETRRPKTIEKVKWSLQHLGSLGDVPLDELDRKAVQAHINRKSRTHAAGTVRTMVQPWSAALELAEADGVIRSNPFRHATLPIVDAAPKQTLSIDEVRRLIIASRGHSGHALVVLGIGLGLRLGEVQALAPRHFAEPGKMVVPGTKTKSAARVLPLPVKIHTELAGLETPLLPNCQTACRNALKRNAARAGIKRHVHPHLLRHTFATLLQWQGCPLDIRARLLGHANSSVTQGYSHAEWSEWSRWLENLATSVYDGLGNRVGKGAG